MKKNLWATYFSWAWKTSSRIIRKVVVHWNMGFFPFYHFIRLCLLSQYRVFWDPEDSFNLPSLATLVFHQANNVWGSWLRQTEPLTSRNCNELHWLSYFLPCHAKLFRPVLFWSDIKSSEFLFGFSTWYGYRSIPDLFARFQAVRPKFSMPVSLCPMKNTGQTAQEFVTFAIKEKQFWWYFWKLSILFLRHGNIFSYPCKQFPFSALL